MFISCEKVKKLMSEQQAQLVDVRTPEEFVATQIPGAVNIPLHEIDHVGMQKLDKTKPVIVFCRSGQRSFMAQQILMGQDFSEVHNMGPYMAWYQC